MGNCLKAENSLDVTFYSSEPGLYPKKQHKSDVGYDVMSGGDYEILPNKTEKIGTGSRVLIKGPWYGQLYSRSGLASKDINVVGGVVDPGYCGEIFVAVKNSSDKTFYVKKYQRIAQLVFHLIPEDISIKYCTDPMPKDVCNKSDRGDKGFGSSGM